MQPVPALALSSVLLFADTTYEVLTELLRSCKTCKDAIVLATPFWAPNTGKLNQPVDLSTGIPQHVAASLSIDPDRELRIDSFDPTTVSDATKALLGTCRRVLIHSSIPTDSFMALLALMPSVKAIALCHVSASVIDIIAKAPSLSASLEELTVNICRDLEDLSVLSPLTALRKLHLGSCSLVTDLSPLASLPKLQALTCSGFSLLEDLTPLSSMKTLEEVSFLCCLALQNTSPLASVPRLKAVTLLHCSNGMEMSAVSSMMKSLERFVVHAPVDDAPCDADDVTSHYMMDEDTSAEDVGVLVKNGMMPRLSSLLSGTSDAAKLLPALQSIERGFDVGQELREEMSLPCNPYAEEFIAYGGFDRLEDLLRCPDPDVHDSAETIIECYNALR